MAHTTRTKDVVTTVKAAPKKAARAKVLPLVVAAESAAFWTVDGQVLYSLVDLAASLKTMERRVYQYHADPAYQDFSVWVKVVLGDTVCARSLKQAKTQKAAYLAVTERLNVYTKA